MQNHIKSLTPSNIVAHLGHIFHHSGSQAYLGEPVTMAQHMLQGASLAEHQGHSNIVIAAALLHDIGHFTSDFGTFSMDDSHDRQHEIYGAKVLAPFFSRIYDPMCAPSCVGQALLMCDPIRVFFKAKCRLSALIKASRWAHDCPRSVAV
jgi:predicted HD phosphohydrolase